MLDSAESSKPSAPSPAHELLSSDRPAIRYVREGFSILLSATAVAWLMRLLVLRDPVQGAWTLQVMLALAALVAASWGAVHRQRHWNAPMNELKKLIVAIKSGEAPIEELSHLDGGVRPLTPYIQELFRELREQRTAIAELDNEIRQRIANKTESLERTIGSLRHQATRDGLTGLFNRRFLDQFLPQSIERHLRERSELCVLMIDVDNFKPLNDTLGHAAGDDLLRAIGQLIRSTARGEDITVRNGGDEFVILMPGHGRVAGQSLADRLISLVDQLAKTIRVAKPPRLSIGVAVLMELKEQTPESLLSAADKALYAVKAERKSLRGLQEPAQPVQSSPLSRKAG